MAMSDCPKCWDTPCTCGHGYRDLSKEARIQRAAVVLGVDAALLKERFGGFVPVDHPNWDGEPTENAEPVFKKHSQGEGLVGPAGILSLNLIKEEGFNDPEHQGLVASMNVKCLGIEERAQLRVTIDVVARPAGCE